MRLAEAIIYLAVALGQWDVLAGGLIHRSDHGVQPRAAANPKSSRPSAQPDRVLPLSRQATRSLHARRGKSCRMLSALPACRGIRGLSRNEFNEVLRTDPIRAINLES
jgi:hypothetical protein